MSKTPGKIILAVMVIGLMILTIWMVDRSFRSSLDPLRQANSEMGTQVFSLLHPTPTIIPDPVTIIHDVQALARLETIRYTVEKVITAESGQGALESLFGDRLLFVAHGYVISGIDMAKLTGEDLWLENGVLNVRLPEAEVFVATLDNDKSYVYDRQTGLLTHGNPDLETLARQAAEQEIQNAAIEDDILTQATLNAQTNLRWFFETLGYQQVNFINPEQ